jgi:2-polyprenyl-6-methoxyphenol hydroxylase-like FAD-dependent oxidoreductase
MRTALVIGGSMAGLLAARVLSDHFDRVIVVERDHFADTPESRQGVPQGRHAHALLAHGEQVLSHLFPGIAADLVAGGGVRGDIGEICRWFQFGGYKVQHRSGVQNSLQTRPFLEWHTRRRLAAQPHVEIRDGCAVAELLRSGPSVAGVVAERSGDRFEIPADLTVDCTGRGSHAPRLLPEMGFDPPAQSLVKIDVGYSSRLFRRQLNDLAGARVVLIFPQPPGDRRGGALMPVEGDRWMCTLGGWAGDYPPTDQNGYLQFAHSLAAPDIYNVISQAEPLSTPVPHRFPSNQRTHYERLTRFPEGYLVMGDAVCSFNPLYGQGMTTSAIQAEALERCLLGNPGPGLALRFFAETAHPINTAWQMAVSEDFRFRGVTGPRPRGLELGNRYTAMVHRAVTRDAYVYGRFLRVLNLLDPPGILFRPNVVFRVLRDAMVNSHS